MTNQDIKLACIMTVTPLNVGNLIMRLMLVLRYVLNMMAVISCDLHYGAVKARNTLTI